MKTIADIRLENLELLVVEFGTQDKVAELAETSPVYLSQLRNKAPDSKTGKLRQIGDPMARKLELGCRKEVGWMDNVHALLPHKVAAVGVSEPTAIYQLPAQSAWPFQSIAAVDFQRLSEFERGQVEGYIKGLLESGSHHRKSNGA